MRLFRKVNVDNNIKAVVSGKTIPIETVEDEVFSSGMMGLGIAIEPENNVVCSPGPGRVISADQDMAHAVGIRMDSGIELLIHIGIDTVALPKNIFRLKVRLDQKVITGMPLIEFDKEMIEKQNYNDTVMVILTDLQGHEGLLNIGREVVSGVDDIIVIT